MGDSAVYWDGQDASEQGLGSNLTASAISLSLCRPLAVSTEGADMSVAKLRTDPHS